MSYNCNRQSIIVMRLGYNVIIIVVIQVVKLLINKSNEIAINWESKVLMKH